MGGAGRAEVPGPSPGALSSMVATDTDRDRDRVQRVRQFTSSNFHCMLRARGLHPRSRGGDINPRLGEGLSLPHGKQGLWDAKVPLCPCLGTTV